MRPPRTKMKCSTCIYVGCYQDKDIYVCPDSRADCRLLSTSGIETEAWYKTAPGEIKEIIEPYINRGDSPVRDRLTNLYWATLKLRS